MLWFARDQGQSILIPDPSTKVIYPNPRHLRAFVALTELGSFSAAAEAVHLGQPALSQAIANLEELVGVRLLERTSRSVRLTPAGEEFLIDARRVLDANERLIRRGAEWAHVRRGRIALLTVPSVAHRLLPALVREFNARHPEVKVEVHDHADPVLKQRLERGEGDLAILTHNDNAAGRPALPFLRDRFRVVFPAGHPFANEKQVDSSQLADEQLILLRRGALFRSFMDSVISRLTLAHQPIEVDQPGTLIGMVEAGLGVSLLPALSCPTPALKSVDSRPLGRPDVFRLLAFAVPVAEPMPAIEEFVRIALAYLSQNAVEMPEGCQLLPIGPGRLKTFFKIRGIAPADSAMSKPTPD
jgi:LysR family carnitine catabolism transcriptional activator